MDDRRTLRQRLVAEIGDAGQARISAARAVIAGDGLAADVEARYLRGAALGAVESDANATPARAAIEGGVEALGVDAAAGAVIAGSARALATIRRALGTGA